MEKELLTLEEKIKAHNFDFMPETVTLKRLAKMFKEGKLLLNSGSDIFTHRLSYWDRASTIESILIGAFHRPIFVVEDEKGYWKIVNGEHVILAIFHFMEVLNEFEAINYLDTLEETRQLNEDGLFYLKELSGRSWWELEIPIRMRIEEFSLRVNMCTKKLEFDEMLNLANRLKVLNKG